jgi:ligand-binding sensor domain-containing protein
MKNSYILLMWGLFAMNTDLIAQQMDASRAADSVLPQSTKLVKTQGSDRFSNIHCSLMDKDGNLWFGTRNNGLYRYDGKSFASFSE